MPRQVNWLLQYLDASVSTWKLILDCWFARTSLGRAAILTSIPAKILTKSMRGNIALPQFWSQALEEALHELKLTQTSLKKNPAWFSHVARAHRWVAPLTNSRPPMAARCEALPSTHLSNIQ
eukprot:scaffold3751_cov117-Isochrysis_galbana.AAC.1